MKYVGVGLPHRQADGPDSSFGFAAAGPAGGRAGLDRDHSSGSSDYLRVQLAVGVRVAAAEFDPWQASGRSSSFPSSGRAPSAVLRWTRLARAGRLSPQRSGGLTPLGLALAGSVHSGGLTPLGARAW